MLDFYKRNVIMGAYRYFKGALVTEGNSTHYFAYNLTRGGNVYA